MPPAPAPESGNVSESSHEAGQQKVIKLKYGGYSTLSIQNIQ